jgi:transposase
MTDQQMSLDSFTTNAIIEACRGLKGRRLAAIAQELAERHEISVKTVYALTRGVRPGRKARADAGKRSAAVLENEGLLLVAHAVAERHVTVEEAVAFAELNGFEIPWSISSVRRWLREHGLTLRQVQRKVSRTPHRRFEGAYPGHSIQVDFSTVQETWLDTETLRTMRIKGVDDNHPNTNPKQRKVWKFVALDDYSRRVWVRFYAPPSGHPSSVEVIDFLLMIFAESGVPENLYTDRDGLLLCEHLKRFFALLNPDFKLALDDEMKSLHRAHAPGNPRATGKVENTHKYIELKWERQIGLLEKLPTLDELNDTFAANIMAEKNWAVHGTTGEKPMLRWRRSFEPRRIPSADSMALLKGKEFSGKKAITVSGRLTLTVPGEGEYQLPLRAPFVDWVGHKVAVVFARDSAFFWVIGLDGKGHEITKQDPLVGTFGEAYVGIEDTTQQTSLKALKTKMKERKKAAKESGAEPLRVRAFEAPTQEPAALVMPRPVETITDLPLMVGPAPEPMPVAPVVVNDFRLPETTFGKWEAIERLQADELLPTPLTESDAAWIDRVFADRERITEPALRTALAERHAPTTAKLRIA